MRPNISVAECTGRKRGLRATLIHVSSGQIIYHLVQTNSVLDSLSEEEEEGWGGGRGWCVRSVRAASDAAVWPPSLFLLSPLLGPLLITPPMQAPGPGDHSRGYTRRGKSCKEVACLHFTLLDVFFFFLKLRSLLINVWVTMHLFHRASVRPVWVFMTSLVQEEGGNDGVCVCAG